MSTPRKQPVNTEVLRYMRPDALLSVKDIQEIFGFKTVHCVHSLIKRGQLPRPTHTLSTVKKFNKMAHRSSAYRRLYWRKDEIIEYLKTNTDPSTTKET